MTFLIPGVKLVVKTFPSKSFSPHGAVEIIGCRLEPFQLAAGLDQLRPFFDDQLEVFDLEDLLDQGQFLFRALQQE